MNRSIAALFGVGIFLLCTEASGSDIFRPVFRPRLEIGKASTAITIDGMLNDAGWLKARKITQFVERYPGENVPPAVRTEVSIAYDNDHLYVAYNCFDDPSSIRATMCQRDQFTGDDAVVLLLDTYGNASWAYEFFVNPYGIQKDNLWTSIQGEDPGFDLIWQSAASITPTGYQVEMAIPFKSLRFPNQDVQTWKMDFWRNHPREAQRQYSWAANDRNEQCFPCQWGTVEGISGVKPGTGVELLPSVVANQSGQLTDRRDPNSSFRYNGLKSDFSLGGKYAVNSDVTVEASLNPDFSQIEADAQQIDVNSTISLFYPERRPYFQEGSDIFRTLFNSFYTRTVNDPDYTAKVTGRMNRTSIGYLVARDANSPYDIPLEESDILLNAGYSTVNVLRGLHTFADNSKLGFLVSDRRFEKNGSGTVLSGDGELRLSSTYRIRGQFIHARTTEPNAPELTAGTEGMMFDRGRHTVAFDGESFGGIALITNFIRSSRNWNFFLDYNQVAPSYRTETGYDPVANHRSFQAFTGYDFYPQNSVFTRITPQFSNFNRWNYDGVKKIQNYAAGVRTELGVWQTVLYSGYRWGEEMFAGVRFNDLWSINGDMESRISDAFGVGFGGSYGRGVAYRALAPGYETTVFGNLDFKPVDRLTISQSMNFSRSTDVETGQRYFNGYISRTRVQLQVLRELSFRLIAQYNDFSRSWSIDPLITYRLSPFSMLYMGATSGYQRLEYPNAQLNPPDWRMTRQQFFMKLQYLFQV